MITIEKGNIRLYCTLFEQYRTDFTDKCAESAARHGHILIAYLEGAAAGYLLTSAEHGSEFIMYVFTLPELRGKGVMQSLIREAVNISDGYIGTAFTDIHKGTSKNPFERKRATCADSCVKSPHLASASFRSLSLLSAQLSHFLFSKRFLEVPMSLHRC